MERMICPECRIEIPKAAWSCPDCGKPGEQDAATQTGKEISGRGMMLLLLLFVAFPVVLFLVHIFVPGM